MRKKIFKTLKLKLTINTNKLCKKKKDGDDFQQNKGIRERSAENCGRNRIGKRARIGQIEHGGESVLI